MQISAPKKLGSGGLGYSDTVFYLYSSLCIVQGPSSTTTEAHPSPAAPAYGLSLLTCCRLPLRQLSGLLPHIFMCFLKEKAALLEIEQMFPTVLKDSTAGE